MADANSPTATPAPTPPPAGTAKPAAGDDDYEVWDEARIEQEREKAREEGRKSAREQAKAEREREKKAEEEAAAREQGKFKELADKAGQERDALRLELQAERVGTALRDYLAEKHPDYLAAAKWIRPHVQYDAGTTPETIQKRVEEAAAAYVKDNPRQAKAGAGAPASPTGGRQAAKGGKGGGGANANGSERPQITGAAARF